jgi:hypothetical protein
VLASEPFPPCCCSFLSIGIRALMVYRNSMVVFSWNVRNSTSMVHSSLFWNYVYSLMQRDQSSGVIEVDLV